MSLKTCNKCLETKDISSFHYKKNRDYYLPSCKVCERKHNNSLYKKRYEKDPEKYREKSRKQYNKNIDRARLQRRASCFGMPIGEFEILINSFESVCQICGITTCPTNRNLSLDHDHTTGKIRGLLCVNCNHGLGKFKDSIKLLTQAIKYIEKYKE